MKIRTLLVLTVAGVLLTALLVSSIADPAITEFPVPTANSGPSGITAGPDGNLWFTEMIGNKIGRITPAGVITGEWVVPTLLSEPSVITVGTDGNLWFTEVLGHKIGRITPTGVPITEWAVSVANFGPYGIAADRHGNLWFTESSENKIGRITTAGVITGEWGIPTSSSWPLDITAGPDNNFWFTEFSTNQIGRITPTGVITGEWIVSSSSGGLSGITRGPDDNLWFTHSFENMIGRITPAGVITGRWIVPTANSGVGGITAGPDGNLWFNEGRANKIGRITPAGVITEFPVPTANSGPSGITASSHSTFIWFTEFRGNKIGRLDWGPALAVTKRVRPLGDPGVFNLQIDGVTGSANVGDGGSTGLRILSVGSHTVGETEGTGTSFASYVTTIDCGTGAVPVSGSNRTITVSLAPGQIMTCTVTNLGLPRLTVTKSVFPPDDPGRFNLQICAGNVCSTKASNVGDGGTTGALVQNPGTYIVIESGGFQADGRRTDLRKYLVDITGDCAENGRLTLATGDTKTCEISNINKSAIQADCLNDCADNLKACIADANSGRPGHSLKSQCVMQFHKCVVACPRAMAPCRKMVAGFNRFGEADLPPARLNSEFRRQASPLNWAERRDFD